MSISIVSWFRVWASIEIMILTIIPLMVSPSNSISNESAIKYFLVQVLRGLLYLSAVISLLDLEWVFVMALRFKLGLAPFHFWVPHVFSGFDYSLLWVVSRVIKLPGLLLIQHSRGVVVVGLAALRVIVGTIRGVYLTNFKKLLAYSSVNHSG